MRRTDWNSFGPELRSKSGKIKWGAMAKSHISETTYVRDLRFHGGIACDERTLLDLVWSLQMVNWSQYEEFSTFNSLNTHQLYGHFKSKYHSDFLKICQWDQRISEIIAVFRKKRLQGSFLRRTKYESFFRVENATFELVHL